MNQGEIFRLYALALGLVPDHDAAGDLFMDASGEEDLRRRAARWRARQGLAPAPADSALPALTPDQREDALHLARRGRLRRKLRVWVAAGAAALVLLGSGALLLRARPTGLTADAVFSLPPVARSEPAAGLRFAVYRAVATPGSVTVWWEVSGAGAGSAGSQVRPSLLLSGSGGEWQAPILQRSAEVNGDRLVGQSSYKLATGVWDRAALHIPSVKGHAVNWTVHATLVRLEIDPAARTLHMERSASSDRHTFALKTVTLAPTYTLVRYEAQSTPTGDWRKHFVRAAADGREGRLLAPQAPPVVTRNAVEVIYDAVPEGATELIFTFETAAEAVAYSLPEPHELISLSREGSRVTARLSLHTALLDRHTVTPLPLPEWPWQLEGSYLTDDRGNRYDVAIVYEGEDGVRNVNLWRLYGEVPREVDLSEIKVRLARLRRAPGGQIRVKID